MFQVNSGGKGRIQVLFEKELVFKFFLKGTGVRVPFGKNCRVRVFGKKELVFELFLEKFEFFEKKESVLKKLALQFFLKKNWCPSSFLKKRSQGFFREVTYVLLISSGS